MWFAIIVSVSLAVEVLSHLSGGEISFETAVSRTSAKSEKKEKAGRCKS